MTTFSASISDGLRLSQTVSVPWQAKGVLSDKAKFGRKGGDNTGYSYKVFKTAGVSERVGVHEAIGLVTNRAVTQRERVGLGITMVPITTYHRAIDGGRFKLKDKLTVAVTAHLRAGLSFHQGVPTAAIASFLHEAMAIRGSTALSMVYRLAALHKISVHDVLKRAYGAALRDAIHIVDHLARTYAAVAAVMDQIEVSDELGLQLQIVVVEQEGLELDDAVVLRSIFKPKIADTINFAIGFTSPSGGVTTWAMNTRTGALTEYRNFGFNSFAKVGTDYFAASRNGLYQLDSDTDGGQPIVADIMSGLMELTGSQFTSFKAAYIAVRGDGRFLLKLQHDERAFTTYAVRAHPLRTARVDLGKGLRARYFSFQLLSTGQDFDLTDVTFLPIASKRRV